MILLNLVQVFKNNQRICGIAVNCCCCLKNIIVWSDCDARFVSLQYEFPLLARFDFLMSITMKTATRLREV